MKRILIISDTHCGSRSGMVPPRWQTTDLQTECWDTYTGWIKELRKEQEIYAIIMNGDAIDGVRGLDKVTTDFVEQMDMASEVIEVAKAKHLRLLAGTDAHTSPHGSEMELERPILEKCQILAEQHGRKYESVDYSLAMQFVVDDVRLNVRHHTSPRNMPQTRGGTGSSDALWDEISAARGLQDRSDIIVRSHTHYFVCYQDCYKTLLITPSLQLSNANYAIKKLNGHSDWGICWIDIEDDDYSIGHKIKTFPGIMLPTSNL